MIDGAHLRHKPRKIDALFAGATTPRYRGAFDCSLGQVHRAMQHTVVVGPLGQAAFLAKISCVALQNVRGPVLSGHMSARTAALASS